MARFFGLARWTFLAFALDKAALFAVVFLAAGILGARDYGRLTLAQGLATSGQIFIVLGAGSTLVRHIPALREQGVRRAVALVNLCGATTAVAGAAFVLFSMAAPAIVTGVLDLAAASAAHRLVVLWVVLHAAGSLLLAVMLAFEKGAALGVASAAGGATAIALVPLLAVHAGLEGALCGLMAAETVRILALGGAYLRLLKREGADIMTPPRRSDLPLLFRFGLPVFLQSSLWAPTLWLAQVIVRSRHPDGLAEVGVFGLAFSILGAVILASGLSNRAAMPVLASLRARGEAGRARRASLRLAGMQTGVAAAIGLAATAVLPIMAASMGPDYARAAPVFGVMIGAGIVIAGQTSLSNHLLLMDRPWFCLATLAPWAAILIGSALAFPHGGALTLAWALLAASLARGLLFMAGFARTPAAPCEADALHAPR